MRSRARTRLGAGLLLSLAATIGDLAVGGPVEAAFAVTASGSTPSLAQSIPQAAAPLASAASSAVTTSWSSTTLSGGTAATVYSVRRYDLSNVLLSTLTNCATGGALSCVEAGVPTGTYQYTVQAGLLSWLGAESAFSAQVVVSPQTLTITSSSTITTLPSNVTGNITNFAVGETLTYRLDSLGGTLLVGSPTTVSSNSSQAISVTVPAGTTDTVHSIFVLGSAGSIASASIRVVIPPTLVSLQMKDTNANGRVDQVLVNFSETLASYTAGIAPWSLLNVPSGGTLASVTTSGPVATLTLTEGTGAPNTAVGTFTIALAQNSSGIRDLNNNLASFAATAPSDGAAPARISLLLQDTNTNGKVNRLTATFSESFAAYSAGNAPWSLLNVPSDGTLASVAVSGSVATLTITEGAGAADTGVGTMSVALSPSATGIRDAAGNLSSFASQAPTDDSAPIPVSITDTNGSIDGRFQSGDTISITFSEALLLSTLPASSTVTVRDPSGSGNDTLTLGGVSSSNRNLGANGYESTNNSSAVFGASSVAVTNGNRTITVTLGASCSGSGCAGLSTQASLASYSFLAATTITDLVGLTSTKTLSVSLRMC